MGCIKFFHIFLFLFSINLQMLRFSAWYLSKTNRINLLTSQILRAASPHQQSQAPRINLQDPASLRDGLHVPSQPAESLLSRPTLTIRSMADERAISAAFGPLRVGEAWINTWAFAASVSQWSRLNGYWWRRVSGQESSVLKARLERCWRKRFEPLGSEIWHHY